MTDPERARKLAWIARLTAEELRGWVWARKFDNRPLFDGEQEALISRARQLGVKDLKGS